MTFCHLLCAQMIKKDHRLSALLALPIELQTFTLELSGYCNLGLHKQLIGLSKHWLSPLVKYETKLRICKYNID